MPFVIFLAAAAAQGAAPQARVDPEQARAQGIAQAQAALAGTQMSPATNPAAVAGIPPAGTAPSNVVNAVAAAGGQAPLNLTCAGAGIADKQRGSIIAGGWGWASMVSHHDRQFADQIDVRLFSGDDRIRIPRTMLPALHGGQDGWFKLKDVEADARSIRAHAAVAAFHNPKVYIDRVTGTISISGKSGDYSGQCQAMDPNAAAKF
jgi:hypothetical protein